MKLIIIIIIKIIINNNNNFIIIYYNSYNKDNRDNKSVRQGLGREEWWCDASYLWMNHWTSTLSNKQSHAALFLEK